VGHLGGGLGDAVDERELHRDVGTDAIDAAHRQAADRRLDEHAGVAQVEPRPRLVARQQRAVHAPHAVLEQGEERVRAGDARDGRLDQRLGGDEVRLVAQDDAVGDLAGEQRAHVGVGQRGGRAIREVPLREQLVADVPRRHGGDDEQRREEEQDARRDLARAHAADPVTRRTLEDADLGFVADHEPVGARLPVGA
jgi:hypothetical protein